MTYQPGHWQLDCSATTTSKVAGNNLAPEGDPTVDGGWTRILLETLQDDGAAGSGLRPERHSEAVGTESG